MIMRMMINTGNATKFTFMQMVMMMLILKRKSMKNDYNLDEHDYHEENNCLMMMTKIAEHIQSISMTLAPIWIDDIDDHDN